MIGTNGHSILWFKVSAPRGHFSQTEVALCAKSDPSSSVYNMPNSKRAWPRDILTDKSHGSLLPFIFLRSSALFFSTSNQEMLYCGNHLPKPQISLNFLIFVPCDVYSPQPFSMFLLVLSQGFILHTVLSRSKTLNQLFISFLQLRSNLLSFCSLFYRQRDRRLKGSLRLCSFPIMIEVSSSPGPMITVIVVRFAVPGMCFLLRGGT